MGLILAVLVFFFQADGAAERIQRLNARLVAPCCWQESVAVHQSPAAAEVRARVERLVAEGKNDREILDGFVAQYGERILIEPQGTKQIWLVLLPAAFLALGGLWVGRYIKHALA